VKGLVKALASYKPTLNLELPFTLVNLDILGARPPPLAIPIISRTTEHRQLQLWSLEASHCTASIINTSYSQYLSIPSREKIFLLSTASRPALRYTQPPIQWVMGTLSPGRGVKLTTHHLASRSRMVELYILYLISMSKQIAKDLFFLFTLGPHLLCLQITDYLV
jgi:hypothetical protein